MADDAQARGGALGRPAVVAIAFAIVALLTSVGAVIVVMRRSAEPAVAPTPTRATIDHAPLATDVTKLKRDVVEKVTDGVRITDAALASSLGLRPDDVITAINGRAIKREFDVYDAILGTSMMDVSIMYVEIVRAQSPVLVRWKLDGELRAARRDPVRPPNPYATPADPLLATITKLDDTHYEIPRSTYDRILANPGDFASQARIVPLPNAEGYKLYAIRPNSLFSTLGLANGDAIRSINGAHPDQISTHKDATRLEIVVVRRNLIEHTLVITIK